MKLQTVLLAAVLLFHSRAECRDIPEALQSFYDTYKGGKCPKLLKGGFARGLSSPAKDYKYCSSTNGQLVWIAGRNSLADMDVDCDGANSTSGRCGNDGTSQGQTTFKDDLSTKYGIQDLDANRHSYIVFGNSGASPKFDPTSVGLRPLSVMAVVCGGKLFYGVWGDTNGGVVTGEASISLATACFGSGISGNSGHDETDVLYLAFPGDQANSDSSVDWNANSFTDFEQSLGGIGDALVAARVCQDDACLAPTGTSTRGTTKPTGKSGGTKSVAASWYDNRLSVAVGAVGVLVGVML